MKAWLLPLAAAALLPAAPLQAFVPGTVTMASEAVVGAPAAGTYRVHVIDVGTGLSVFVEGQDFTLLYDAGSNDDFGRGADADRVLAYLKTVRPDLTTIDHVVLSHPHKDHVEMMDDVLEGYAIGAVWDSGSLNDTCGYRAFLDVVAEKHIAYHDALGADGTHDAKVKKVSCHGKQRPATTLRLPRGTRIGPVPLTVPLGAGAEMTFLHADGTRKGPSDFNESSVVVRLTLGGRTVLLPGDGEAGGRQLPKLEPRPNSTEGQILACCTASLRSDVLVASHHGSKTSSRVRFLDAIAASEYIVSVGPKAYSGTVLPDKEVMAEYDRRGTVWRTNLTDKTCGKAPTKIGKPADGKPGGCDNVVVAIDAAGALAVGYFRAAR